jgi:hypothetical protein
LSPKNNKDGVLAVLEATKCNIWVNAVDASPLPLVQEVLQERLMLRNHLNALYKVIIRLNT